MTKEAVSPASGDELGSEHAFVARLAASDTRDSYAVERESVRRGLDEVLAQGYARVPILALVRGVSRLIPLGPAWLRTGIALVVTGGWPYLLVLVLTPFSSLSVSGWTAHLFLITLTVVSVSTLAFGRLAWKYARGLTPALSDLLAPSPQRDGIAAWIGRRMSDLRQIPQAAAFSAAVVAVVVIASRQGGTLPANPLIYLAAAWLGLLGGSVTYWLYVAARAPMKLLRCANLQMAWMDPAFTPAIVALCRTYALVSTGMAVGVLVSEAAAILLPGRQTSGIVYASVVVFPVLAAITAIYVGVMPYVYLSRIVRRHIDTIVAPYLAQQDRPPVWLLESAGIEKGFQVYTHFRGRRTLPFNVGIIVQYVVGICVSLVVYALQQMLS